MPETIWGYLLAFATGAAGAAFTLALEFYRKKLEYGTDLRQRRLLMYKQLWNMTKVLPKYPREADVTYKRLTGFSEELRDWYYGEGGMYLSRKAQQSYVALQETITAILEVYLFSWGEIPRNDNAGITRILKNTGLIKKQVNQNCLIDFLKQKFDIEWAKTAKIEKIDDGMTIILSFEKNSLSLRLNDEKNKVNLKIDDSRTYEFIAKKENGRLNVYFEGKRSKDIITNDDYDKIRDKCSALRTELTNDILSRRRLENLLKF